MWTEEETSALDLILDSQAFPIEVDLEQEPNTGFETTLRFRPDAGPQLYPSLIRETDRARWYEAAYSFGRTPILILATDARGILYEGNDLMEAAQAWTMEHLRPDPMPAPEAPSETSSCSRDQDRERCLACGSRSHLFERCPRLTGENG